MGFVPGFYWFFWKEFGDPWLGSVILSGDGICARRWRRPWSIDPEHLNITELTFIPIDNARGLGMWPRGWSACLASTKTQDLSAAGHKLAMVAHACNPSKKEVKGT